MLLHSQKMRNQNLELILFEVVRKGCSGLRSCTSSRLHPLAGLWVLKDLKRQRRYGAV